MVCFTRQDFTFVGNNYFKIDCAPITKRYLPITSLFAPSGVGGGILSTIAYTGRLRLKGVPFFRLQVYDREGVSLVEVYERVGKSGISVCESAQTG